MTHPVIQPTKAVFGHTTEHWRSRYHIHHMVKNRRKFGDRVPFGMHHGSAPCPKEFDIHIIPSSAPRYPSHGEAFLEIPINLMYKRPYGHEVAAALNRGIGLDRDGRFKGWYLAYPETEHVTVDMLSYDLRMFKYICTLLRPLYPDHAIGWFLLPQSFHAQVAYHHHYLNPMHQFDFLPIRDMWDRTISPVDQTVSGYTGYPGWWIKLPVRLPFLITHTGRPFWRGTFDEVCYLRELKRYQEIIRFTPHHVVGAALHAWYDETNYLRNHCGTKLEHYLCIST